MKKTFVIYDNIRHRDSEVYQRILDLDHYYHYQTAGWDMLMTQDIDATLDNLARSGTERVVVSALGNFLRNASVRDDAIADCDAVPLIAHIIASRGYYYLDPQFFALDLKLWQAVGSPRFDTVGNKSFDSVVVVRSNENVHDDYTPLWIKPGTDRIQHSPEYLQFGWSVVRAFMEHGYAINNVSNSIRNRKVHLYPNDNLDDLVNWIADYNYQPTTIPLKRYADHINQLFEWQSKTVYVQNSEDVIKQSVGALDHYTGVCGGLKAVAVLSCNGFHSNTRVDLFDVSQPALDYQQYLVDHWNGDFDSYNTVYTQFRELNPDLSYAWRSWNTWDNEIDNFLTSAGMTRGDFKLAWQQYCQLDIRYTCVDLLDQDAVLKFFVNTPGRNYIWVSNAYNMEHTIARYGVNHMNAVADELIAHLKAQPGEAWLERENYLTKLR